jgi:hypothetical protein
MENSTITISAQEFARLIAISERVNAVRRYIANESYLCGTEQTICAILGISVEKEGASNAEQ